MLDITCMNMVINTCSLLYFKKLKHKIMHNIWCRISSFNTCSSFFFFKGLDLDHQHRTIGSGSWAGGGSWRDVQCTNWQFCKRTRVDSPRMRFFYTKSYNQSLHESKIQKLNRRRRVFCRKAGRILHLECDAYHGNFYVHIYEML